MFEDAGDRKGVTSSMLIMADMHLAANDPDEALVCAREAVQAARQMDCRKAQAAALQRQAMAHIAKNDCDSALQAASEARKQSRAIMDKQSELSLLHVMAHASLSLGMQSDAALKNLQGSKNTAALKEHAGAMRRAVREAVASAKSALALARWMGDKVQIGLSLIFLAQSHILANHTGEALRHAAEAQALFAELGDAAEEAHSLIIMAEIYAEDGKDDQAVEFANKGLTLARQVGDYGLEDRAITVVNDIIGKKAQPEQKSQQQIEYQAEAAVSTTAVAAPAKQGLDPEWVKETVTKMIQQSLAGDEEVHEDSPLLEAGMDSLTSVSFRNGLNQTLGMNLPAALMFDYPSMRAITAHVVEVSQS